MSEGRQVVSGLSASQLSAMFEATPVALLVFDADLTMVHANPLYLDAVGMDLGAITGRYVFDVFPDDPGSDGPSQAASLESVMRAAVQRRETQVLSEYRYDIPAATGGFEQRVWNVTEVPVLDADGGVELVLHYTEDITDLVRIREARERAALVADALRVDLERLNARLREAGERDRSIAETLQRALLTDLPESGSVRLRAGYRPAAGQIGGDWYDAIATRNGATTVMIGDVVGHDIQAAATMGQLRNMLRTLAWAQQSSPSATLALLDQAMLDLDLDTFATVLLATIDPPPETPDDGLGVTWANAGHLPPMRVTADGEVDVLDDAVPDVLLGVDPELPRQDSRTTLAPGDQLLLYTDGLVETRGDAIDSGIDRLADVVRRLRHEPDLVERVIDDMTGEHPEDDVAVVVIERPLPTG